MLLFAIVNCSLLIQVLLVAKKRPISWARTNFNVGPREHPSKGSCSLPVVNLNILPRSMQFLLPPELEKDL